MSVIGIVGFKGSGKGTIGSYLYREYGYAEDSFAKSLKDATSSIFNWDRELLEGETKQSREWREEIDEWWSSRLGYEVTPRKILQTLGTETIRTHFHRDIWIYSIERRIANKKVVITDCRFPNEIALIKKMNGVIWHVKKGSDPDWFAFRDKSFFPEFMVEQHPEVHISEWSWCSHIPDVIIKNNKTIPELYQEIDKIMKGS